jgi:competence protein ComEC
MRRRLFMLASIFLLALLALAILIFPGLLPASDKPPPGGDVSQNVTYAPPQGCGLLSVRILNVSQADAILITTPSNRTILVDSGSGMKKDSASKVAEELNGMGIKRIDYLIATHYHEDHIGGMEDIENGFEVGTLYSNGNCGGYKSVVAEKLASYSSNHSSVEVAGDMDLPSDPCLSQARLIVAYDRPEGCWKSDTSAENDNSILLRLVYGNTSVLLAGDCEADCEAELVKQGTFLRSDILKAGHHGSATSSTDQFLQAVGATDYVISVDRARSITDGYYHPRQAALSRIFSHRGQGKTFRTDLEGDIDVISDGNAITILPQAQATDCDIFSGYASADKTAYGNIAGLLCG